MDVESVFRGTKNAKLLDYVCCWYRKAADFIRNTQVGVTFVSTNSISQGEQVGLLWSDLLTRGVRISFAHRTFEWSSEARGRAAVHCVIIGFGTTDPVDRIIFDYEDIQGEPQVIHAANINPYLVDAPDIVLDSRREAVCQVPAISYGSMPNDGGFLLFDATERDAMVASNPSADAVIRPFLGSVEFINGDQRYCLWLKGVSPAVIRAIPEVMERVERVRGTRLASSRAATRELAGSPALFGEDRQPTSSYVAIPKTSSERRTYIPIGFLEPTLVASTELFRLEGAQLYHFGVLTSLMHMSWVRSVCGRLKSDYRYSAGIVYNNYPWPNPTDAHRNFIEVAAQGVLDARAAHPGSTLADLYDPLTMPPDLLKAHQKLDRAVDAAYGKKDFKTEAERVAFLFERYQQLTAPLAAAAESGKTKPKRRPKKS